MRARLQKAKLPNRYGRLVTTGDGALEAIVEANDASEAQLAIQLRIQA